MGELIGFPLGRIPLNITLKPIIDSWPFLLKALWITVSLSISSMLLGLVIGIIVGTLRTYGGRLINAVLGFYVDTMRSIPLLVVLVWTFLPFRWWSGARSTR